MKIKIEDLQGYTEEMSDADKLNLLLNYDIPDPDYSGYVKKEVQST